MYVEEYGMYLYVRVDKKVKKIKISTLLFVT
jgi:hypothetical protein